MNRRAAITAIAVASAVAIAGCGLGAGPGTGGVQPDGHVRLRRRVRSRPSSATHVPGSETVMRMLERRFDVKTRYGGGFVESINGQTGTSSQRDWFYYVNGVQAPEGAAVDRRAPRRPHLVRPPRLAGDRLDPGRRRLVPGAVHERDRRQALPDHDRVRVDVGAACKRVTKASSAATASRSPAS